MGLLSNVVVSLLVLSLLVVNSILLWRKFAEFTYFDILASPFLGFHFTAFIVSFLHWFFDTWTVKNDSLRLRTFNQAKTHHYYPDLVVKKDFFSRNDDAFYGAIIFGVRLLFFS